MALGSLVGAVVSGALVGAVLTGVGMATALAQTTSCLPAPNLLFSEVAQVAGINSQVWADLQEVEKADEASGTAGSGQVIQDMLAVLTRDGYQWDCTSNVLLVGPSGTPSSGVPADQGQTGASGNTANAPLTEANRGSGTSATPADVGGSGTNVASPATSSGGGSGGEVSVLVLGGLALVSAAVVVVVVRRQMARR